MLNRLLGALRRDGAAVAESPLTPLLEDVARAIPGANPCGEDVSYDPDFLRLKEEIDKLNAVDTRVDQEKAAELSRQLKANGHGVPEIARRLNLGVSTAYRLLADVQAA